MQTIQVLAPPVVHSLVVADYFPQQYSVAQPMAQCSRSALELVQPVSRLLAAARSAQDAPMVVRSLAAELADVRGSARQR